MGKLGKWGKDDRERIALLSRDIVSHSYPIRCEIKLFVLVIPMWEDERNANTKKTIN